MKLPITIEAALSVDEPMLALGPANMLLPHLHLQLHLRGCLSAESNSSSSNARHIFENVTNDGQLKGWNSEDDLWGAEDDAGVAYECGQTAADIFYCESVS